MVPEEKNWLLTEATFINKFEDKVTGKFILSDTAIEYKVDRSKKYRMDYDFYDMTIDY